MYYIGPTNIIIIIIKYHIYIALILNKCSEAYLTTQCIVYTVHWVVIEHSCCSHTYKIQNI